MRPASYVYHIDFDIKTDRMLTKRVVAKMLGVSPQTISRWVKAGTFPKPITLGTHVVRWVDRHVKEWLHKQTKKEQ